MISKKVLSIVICSFVLSSTGFSMPEQMPEQEIQSGIRKAFNTTINIARKRTQQIFQFAQEHKIAVGSILGFIAIFSLANNLSYIQHDLIGNGILRKLPDAYQNFIDQNIVSFTTTAEARAALNKTIEDLLTLDESIIKTFSSETANIAEIQQVKEYRRRMNKLYDEGVKPEFRSAYHTWHENDPVTDEEKSRLYQSIQGFNLGDFVKELRHNLETEINIDSIRALENKMQEDIRGACNNINSYKKDLTLHTEKLTPEEQIIYQEISKILTDQCA